MPNRHSIRQNKSTDLLLVDKESRDQVFYEGDRENMIPKMNADQKTEALQFISDRIDTAVDQTSDMREVMAKADKQYKGEWLDAENTADEDIFLPMTREDINAVKAYLISILAQITPIVRMAPSGTGTIMSRIEEDYKRAKLNEALFMYYWGDVWKAVDDIMPRFLTHYLKYPIGVLKVGYYETDYNPDLILEVVDRGFLYIDPRANTIYESGWIGHEYYVPRSEVFSRIDRGDWSLNDIEYQGMQATTGDNPQSVNMERFFGKNRTSTTTITEDEEVRCIDYWQFPRNGLPDVYATIIGISQGDQINCKDGILVRYGRNPFPVKGNPFIGASFNPDDRPDGQSMAMLQEPFQRVANTLYNIRVADVRKNVRDAQLVLEQMVDNETLDDLKKGNRLVRVAKAFGEYIMENPGYKISDFIAQFPGGTSTAEILVQDLQFILSMGQKSANTPDVFRGMNAQPGATLGQIQEQLSRTTGQFTPIIRSIMRLVERVAEFSTAFFRSEDFYDEERIIRIVGKNAYKDTIEGWHSVDQNTAYKSVTADMVDTDMTFDAISGADAIASKTLLMTNFERIMQSFAQAPQLIEQAAKKINFPNLFMRVLDISGVDSEYLTYSDKEQQENEKLQQQQMQQASQQQQQQMAMQMQMQAQMAQMQAQIDTMKEQEKQKAMAQKQIMVDQAKGIMAGDLKAEELELMNELSLEQLDEKGRIDRQNKLYELRLEIKRMNEEADIEEASFARGKEVSVGPNSNNVEVDHGSTKS